MDLFEIQEALNERNPEALARYPLNHEVLILAVDSGPESINTLFQAYPNLNVVDLLKAILSIYRPEFHSTVESLYAGLNPDEKDEIRHAILISDYPDDFPSITQLQVVPNIDNRRLSSPNQVVPENRQMTVDELLSRIESTIDQEDTTTVNHLSQSGIFNRPDLLAPVLRRSLLRKIRPKYEGAEADTADWVRWLVKNGA